MSPISSSQYKILFSILTSDKYPSDSLDRRSDPIVRCADIQPPVLPGQVGQLYLLTSNVSSWKLGVTTHSMIRIKVKQKCCVKRLSLSYLACFVFSPSNPWHWVSRGLTYDAHIITCCHLQCPLPGVNLWRNCNKIFYKILMKKINFK